MPFHFGFCSNNSGRFGEKKRARKSSHLSRSSMRLSGKHSYSVSIAMVTRGPEQGMLGVAGKPLWCLVSRVLTKHIRLMRNSDFFPCGTSPWILWCFSAVFLTGVQGPLGLVYEWHPYNHDFASKRISRLSKSARNRKLWCEVLCCAASICESLCRCAEQAGPGTMVPVGCHDDSGVTPQGVSGEGGWGLKEKKKNFLISLSPSSESLHQFLIWVKNGLALWQQVVHGKPQRNCVFLYFRNPQHFREFVPVIEL